MPERIAMIEIGDVSVATPAVVAPPAVKLTAGQKAAQTRRMRAAQSTVSTGQVSALAKARVEDDNAAMRLAGYVGAEGLLYESGTRCNETGDANLRTARAAGQWERIDRTKAVRGYLVYELGPSEHHRPLHEQWAGTILPVDDPWWDTHFTPNGWGCKCFVRQIGRAELARLGGVKHPPPTTFVKYRNSRTGQVLEVPAGIDPGWDFNPGKIRLGGLSK